MPELPEVETIISSLKNAGIVGKKIKKIELFFKKIAKTDLQKILNKKILDIFRKGKQIVFALSDRYFLIVHLKMTGHFFLYQKTEPKQKHEHLRLYLDDTVLAYWDSRRFGKISLTQDIDGFFKNLAPDPFSISFDKFYNQFKIKDRIIKVMLLDQKEISGLGNIYVDEALWKARIHPRQKSKTLSKEKFLSLFEAIKEVLTQGIKNRGTSIGKNISNFSDIYQKFGTNQNHLNVYKKVNSPCSRCNTLIKREKIVQRSSFFCPKCQKLF